MLVLVRAICSWVVRATNFRSIPTRSASAALVYLAVALRMLRLVHLRPPPQSAVHAVPRVWSAGTSTAKNSALRLVMDPPSRAVATVASNRGHASMGRGRIGARAKMRASARRTTTARATMARPKPVNPPAAVGASVRRAPWGRLLNPAVIVVANHASARLAVGRRGDLVSQRASAARVRHVFATMVASSSVPRNAIGAIAPAQARASAAPERHAAAVIVGSSSAVHNVTGRTAPAEAAVTSFVTIDVWILIRTSSTAGRAVLFAGTRKYARTVAAR
jgi:hypothetical protein